MSKKILPLDFPELDERIYAGFWRRFGAMWLDFLIVAPISFGILYINNLERLNYFYTIIPSHIIFFIYHIYFVKLWGATPGKLITKISIVRMNGTPVGWREAILRHIVQFLLGFVGMIALAIPLLNMTDAEFASRGIWERHQLMIQLAPFWYKLMNWANNVWIWSEFIVLLLNKRKRALHDFVAGTLVIKKKYEIIAEQYAGTDSENNLAIDIAYSKV